MTDLNGGINGRSQVDMTFHFFRGKISTWGGFFLSIRVRGFFVRSLLFSDESSPI